MFFQIIFLKFLNKVETPKEEYPNVLQFVISQKLIFLHVHLLKSLQNMSLPVHAIYM